MTITTAEQSTNRYYLRFSVGQRIQHLVLMASVATLIITGIPVRYAGSDASATMVQWLGGYAARGVIHRVAAVVFLLLCLYHLLFTLRSEAGRREWRELRLGRQDVRDFFAMLGYYFSRRRERPGFGRYSYMEKIEYWAVVCGVVVMGVSGLMLWLNAAVLFVLPKWTLDAARVVHSYEGLLLFLTIILWHFYNVHLGPWVFPMSLTWLDGLVDEERMRAEHLREYEQVRDDPVRWITKEDRGQVALSSLLSPAAATLEQVPVRVGSVVTAAIGGVLSGISAPVVMTPLLALTVWLLNPYENPWGGALLCVSLILLPSAILGACIATALALVGKPARAAIVVSISGLTGLYAGMVSVWVPFAAVVYVARWFLPVPAAAQAWMLIALVLSLVIGLVGTIAGVVRGSAIAGSLFRRRGESGSGKSTSE